jgi:hypothetical protein
MVSSTVGDGAFVTGDALRIRVDAFMSAISNNRFGNLAQQYLLSLMLQMNTAGLSSF